MAHALDRGIAAPTVEVRADGGAAYTLPPGGGKVLWIDFWASWCGPCRHSFPWLNAMQAKYGPRGFEVIGVNLDLEGDEAAAFLAKVPASFRVVYDPDGKSPALYGVQGMPTSVLLGRDGHVLLQHIGFTDSASVELERAIADAVEARP